MNKKIFKPRYYQHIDKIININDVINKIKNKEFVVKHGFYPFLGYAIIFKKYIKDGKSSYKRDKKPRYIKYASHIDRCIYQWYGYILNNEYNKYCNHYNLNEVSIAYRTNLKGKTNIEFAKKAFDFIKKSKECYIIVSDFSKFFDYIEHQLLKKKICEILETDKLESDMYKVFKSMTKYSCIEKSTIERYLISKKIETKKSLKLNNSLFDKVSWKEAKKDLKKDIKVNDNTYGIPQGSPLSGIFANIYMIEFDKMVNEYVKENAGLYMRYSDDIIIIIPKDKIVSVNEIWKKLMKIKEHYPRLIMNIDKSSGYLYENNKVISLHERFLGLNKSENVVNYLGFSFDGKYVRFRNKTLTKFFYKMYRKIDRMKKNEKLRVQKAKKRHSKIDKHRILKELNYSKGKAKKFIDYVYRAKKVFKNEKYIINFERNIKSKVFRRFENKKEKVI